MQNPSRSQLLAFSLLLVEFPARRPKLGCLFLSVRIFARASASRLADLRALAPIGARGHNGARSRSLAERIRALYLIPNRSSYPESVILSRFDILSK